MLNFVRQEQIKRQPTVFQWFTRNVNLSLVLHINVIDRLVPATEHMLQPLLVPWTVRSNDSNECVNCGVARKPCGVLQAVAEARVRLDSAINAWVPLSFNCDTV